METSDILLKVTPENMAEAEFMSVNFIDKEIKNRAFINTLGAEIAVSYLADNGIDISSLRHIHSIKRVIEKTNIADIILPNIHIDVRVVFDDKMIFIPKSHFDFGILPDLYMVLKLNENFEDMDFLGYLEPQSIDKEKCNDSYYFVNVSQLEPADNFIDTVKNYSSVTEKTLSESEFLRGRELSVSASDDDISDSEYKEFLQLLKSSLELRDSILEYDNFETLAGQVAPFLRNNSGDDDNLKSLENMQNDIDGVDNDNSLLDLSANDINLSVEEDSNGDSLLDDDNFQTNATDQDNIEALDIGSISDVGASAEAIELAGMSGDAEIQDSSDVGQILQDTDSENIEGDLLYNIDSIDVDLEANAGGIDNVSDTLDFDSDSLQDFGEETAESANDELEQPTEAISEFENNQLDLDQEELLDADLDLSEDDLLSIDDKSKDELEDDNESLTQEISDSDEEKAGNKENVAYSSENTAIDSFEEYDITNDSNYTKIGFEKDLNQNNNAESFDFSEIEYDGDIERAPQMDDEQQSEEDLLDFSMDSDITEEPQDYGENPEVDINDDSVDFEELNNQSDIVDNASGDEVVITDDVINNSEVIENSTIISDKNFEPGEILLDINKSMLPQFDESGIGDLYNNQNENPSALNNDVRIGRNFNMPSISSKYGIIGLFLIIATAGIILFSVGKVMQKPQDEAQPVSGSLNPESNVKDSMQDTIKLNPDNVVLNDEDDSDIKTAKAPTAKTSGSQTASAPQNPSRPIPPTSFLSVKKLSWEVPDYISYSPEFRQYFQSSGKSLKTALTSDLLLATDYTYSNLVKLSVSFDKNGKFIGAKIISSSGSADVDKIVLQSVNQTLNLLKAPNSLENNESTVVILKIYL